MQSPQAVNSSLLCLGPLFKTVASNDAASVNSMFSLASDASAYLSLIT